MAHTAITPSCLAFNLEIMCNHPQKVCREPYIDLWWVPGGSNGTLKTSKSCYKSLEMWFNSILLRYRACISGLGHFRNGMAQNIFVSGTRGHKRAFLWLLEGEISLHRDSKPEMQAL